MLKERIDVQGRCVSPAYQKLLKRHHMEFLDGVKATVWSIERQWEYLERLDISCATRSLFSPHLHMGDKEQKQQLAASC